jgi:hypothetical protein
MMIILKVKVKTARLQSGMSSGSFVSTRAREGHRGKWGLFRRRGRRKGLGDDPRRRNEPGRFPCDRELGTGKNDTMNGLVVVVVAAARGLSKRVDYFGGRASREGSCNCALSALD